MTDDDDAIGEEFVVGDPRALPPEPVEQSWHLHDWTGQEASFAAAFLRHANAARAWREAFNDSRPVHITSLAGNRLLHKPWMRDYIAHCRDLIRQRLVVNEKNIIEEVAKIAFANMTDFIVITEDGLAQTDLSGLTREQLAAISEMTIDTYMDGKGEGARPVRSVKFKLAPKLAALELLGKKHKLWTDVVENTSIADIADEIRMARMNKRNRQKEIDDGNDGTGQDAASDAGDGDG